MAEGVFGPLGMADTAFEVPAGQRDRFTSYYRAGPDGGLELGEGPVAILLTQVAADSPIPPEWMRNFWRYAATASA